MTSQEQLSKRISSLKQQRDELAVQMHLAKLEAKEEWERVTAKLDKLSDDFEPVRSAVGKSAGNVYEALKIVVGEIEEGFQRIRKSL